MQIFGLVSLLVVLFAGALFFIQTSGPLIEQPEVLNSTSTPTVLDPVIVAAIEAHADLVTLSSPRPLEEITSPATISGKARGYWYFEGDFPVILTDWDGRIIAETTATARNEWMTEEFVSFTARLDFKSPFKAGDPDFMRRGSLILKKDNPSGLPENDDALEIPIYFSAPNTLPVNAKPNYQEAIDQAEEAARMLEL